MFIIIVFRLGSDKLCVLFILLSFPRDQSRDVSPRLGESGWFFIFGCSSVLFIMLINFHYNFFSPISSIVLTCYVYYYRIWLGFNMLFSCFFTGFLLFSPKILVTGCDYLLGSVCYSPMYLFSCMHLHSGYYYYDYVIISVLRPLWFTEILFWIGLQLYTVVKQLKIIVSRWKVSISVERSWWPHIRWCVTGGFQEQGQCLFIGIAASSLFISCCFPFLFLHYMGWYCGDGVFGLMSC